MPLYGLDLRLFFLNLVLFDKFFSIFAFLLSNLSLDRVLSGHTGARGRSYSLLRLLSSAGRATDL